MGSILCNAEWSLPCSYGGGGGDRRGKGFRTEQSLVPRYRSKEQPLPGTSSLFLSPLSVLSALTHLSFLTLHLSAPLYPISQHPLPLNSIYTAPYNSYLPPPYFISPAPCTLYLLLSCNASLLSLHPLFLAFLYSISPGPASHSHRGFTDGFSLKGVTGVTLDFGGVKPELHCETVCQPLNRFTVLQAEHMLGGALLCLCP